MTTASNATTVTVTDATKAVALSRRLCLYESVPVTVSLASGQTFPAGSYTLALTYYGQTMALAGCSVVGANLTATLSLNTEELADLFSNWSEDTKRLALDLSVWDNTGRVYWARGKVDVWRTDYVPGNTPTPLASGYYNGDTAISAGASMVTVSLAAYSLGAVPSQIFVSVRGPSGADVISATVGASSASAFTVQLSAAVPTSEYELCWLVFP